MYVQLRLEAGSPAGPSVHAAFEEGHQTQLIWESGAVLASRLFLHEQGFSQMASFKNKAGRGSQTKVSVSPLYCQNLSSQCLKVWSQKRP